MAAYTRTLFCFVVVCHFAFGVLAQKVNGDVDYGLAFASHEVIKDDRTSLNLTPDAAFRFNNDFEIQFDLAFQRLTNSYGYILRIIANDSLNIDLVASPEHNEFSDLNLVINDASTTLDYEFSDLNLRPFQWTEVVIGFSYKRNEVSLSWGGKKKTQRFPASAMRTFRFYFGANDYGKFKTSDVPPIIVKNIALTESGRIVQKWLLKKHHVTAVYDSVNERRAVAKNPVWLLDKHRKWAHRKEFAIGKFPSVAFNGEAGLLYAIDEKRIYTYDLAKEKLDTHNSVQGNPVFTDANQLIYVEETGQLINYDVHTNKFVPFDLNANSWPHHDASYHEPEYWHHNKFYNPVDSTVYTFGGYGHFSYKGTFFRYNDTTRNWEVVETEGAIPPRYLAASGLTTKKDKLLIYGGYGSISGKQELSPQVFHDLYTFDFKTKQVQKVWEFEVDHTWQDIVLSNSLVVNDADSHFYVLTFPKNKYECYIKMNGYALSGPESAVLADSIPFRFHDENAFTDLFLSRTTKELIAVTAHEENEQFKINVYSINYPPLSAGDVLQSPGAKDVNAMLYYAFIAAGLICIAVLYVSIRKRRDHKSTKAPARIAGDNVTSLQDYTHEPPAVPTINLFGGFQVLDKSGQDITAKFTTTLRELFVLILLYSVKHDKGISTVVLQEYLWPDKDEMSARNNRNVNIKKLRTILQEIGDISIENNNDYLHLSLGNTVCCDYRTVHWMLSNVSSATVINCDMINVILTHVKRGNLLPDLQNSWVDTFKSDISNRVIDILLAYSEKLDVRKDSKTLIEIADSIFNYDSINQEALVIKCSVLNKKGNYALAKNWYEHYVKEYETLYAEAYPKTFEEVIS